MKEAKQLALVVLGVLLSLSAAISLGILLSPIVYQVYIAVTDLAETVGLTQSQLMTNFKEIIHYLVSPFQQHLTLSSFSSSPGGLQHFKEVKFLCYLNFFLMLALLLAYVFVYRQVFARRVLKRDQVRMRQWFAYASLLPLVLLALIVFSFDRVFFWFHQLLFRNDLWLFDPLLDPVINVLPQSLFMLLFLWVIILYELVLFLMRMMIR